MEERHDKVEKRGKAVKILLLLLLRRKLKSVISDGNCKLRIFLVLVIVLTKAAPAFFVKCLFFSPFLFFGYLTGLVI